MNFRLCSLSFVLPIFFLFFFNSDVLQQQQKTVADGADDESE